MKKLLSILLCLVLIVSMFSVSAYAAGVLLHSSGESGVTTQATTAGWYNYNGDDTTHYFPASSPFTLIADLYSGDTYAKVSIFDPVDHYRIESTSVRANILSFS